jgi:hypothetical protein
MLRTGVILVGLLLVVLAVANVDAFKRHPRSPQKAMATENLANPTFNGVVNSSLGHYFIYYGSQFGSGGADANVPAAVKQYCTDFSGSEYLNVCTQYYGRSTSDLATNQIHFVGESIVGAPYGLTLSSSTSTCVLKILERLLQDTSRAIPFDATTQYYMILGSDVTISNAPAGANCGDTGACGLHNQQNIKINGATYKILTAWVAVASGCIGQQVSQLTGPNADANTQSVLDTLSHEVAETITDPNQLPSDDRAWQTPSDGSEIGDLCSTYYGTVKPSTKKAGAYYNVLANGNEYMVQGQWSNADGGCVLGVPLKNVSPSSSAAAGASPSSSAAAGASPSSSAAAGASPSSSTAAGASPSNSGAAPPSASNFPTASPSASTFSSGVPSSNCITCPVQKCRKEKKFKKVCEKKLGGTFSNSTAGSLCCNNPKGFESFTWSVAVASCDYPIGGGKLGLLCSALGGRKTCEIGFAGGVRLTCDK